MQIFTDLYNYLFRNKRRKKVIDFFSQLQISLEILLHVVLFAVLVILCIYIYPLATMFSEYSLETHQDTLATLIKMNVGKWPLFILVALVVSLVSILFSHRICGPAYKIRLMLDKYANKDLTSDTFLRKHDYLFSLLDPLNRVRRTWAEDMDRIKAELTQLNSIASRLPGDSDGKTKITNSLEQLSSIISAYSLPESSDSNDSTQQRQENA